MSIEWEKERLMEILRDIPRRIHHIKQYERAGIYSHDTMKRKINIEEERGKEVEKALLDLELQLWER